MQVMTNNLDLEIGNLKHFFFLFLNPNWHQSTSYAKQQFDSKIE